MKNVLKKTCIEHEKILDSFTELGQKYKVKYTDGTIKIVNEKELIEIIKKVVRLKGFYTFYKK